MKKLLVVALLVALCAGAVLPGLAQGNRQPISIANAAQLVERIRLGRGTADYAAFSRDGQTVAIGGSVGVWLYPVGDVGTATEPPLIRSEKAVVGIAFAPDGRTLAINNGTQIEFWDYAAGKMVSEITPARSSKAIAYSPDGSLLAINMGGSGISLWDVAAGAERLLIAGSIQGDAALVFSPDGSLLAGSTTDYKGHLWRVADGTEAALLEGHTRYLYDFVFSPDGSVVATASYDKSIRVWEVATGTEMATLMGTEAEPLNEAYSIAVSPDGNTLASGHAGGKVAYWDLNAMAPALVFGPLDDNIMDLAFSPDGSRVVTASGLPGVALWDAASGSPVAAAVGHTEYMSAAVFSPDSTRLAITDWAENVWLWDTAAMQQLNFTAPLPDLVGTGVRNSTMLVYAPNNSVVAVTDGFDVSLLDAVSGAVVRELTGCGGLLASMSFSPDSTLLAEATSTSVCVSDVATGQLLASFTAGDWMNTIEWSPDQTLLAATNKDHTVRVYGLP